MHHCPDDSLLLLTTMPLHADVYAEQLFHLGHGYGYPLWGPKPPPDQGKVFVGDVSYICNGSFHRVFNALRSKRDPGNISGVPKGYEPFSLVTGFFTWPWLAPGTVICSKTVKHLLASVATA